MLAGKSGSNYAIEVDQFGYTQFGEIFYMGSGIQGHVSIYNSNDSVFWWRNNQWSLLLDFSAQTGDSWYIAENEANWDPYCSDVAVATVTGYGTTTIGGTNYRYIDVECSADSPLRLSGRFYERFGGDFFIPMVDICDPMVVLDYDMIDVLRCFEDDDLQLNFVGEDCLYLITHLELSENEVDELQLYPNPSTGSIYFNLDVDAVEVVDISGKLIRKIVGGLEQNAIDLNFLSEGVYLLYISRPDGGLSLARVSIKSAQ